jgi:hypothetical protein
MEHNGVDGEDLHGSVKTIEVFTQMEYPKLIRQLYFKNQCKSAPSVLN